MKSKYYLIMLLAFIKCHTAFSQGLDASPSGIMISHGHPKGGFMFSYTYMNMMMKDNLSGKEKISDQVIFNHDYSMSPHTMKMDMHMLMAMYGVTGRLSFMFMTNYTKMNMDMTAFSQKMDMEGGTMIMSSPYMSVQSSGLGDSKLYGLYKLLNGNGSSLVLSAGINIPTGKTNVNGGELYLNMRLPYMMQLGSGSFDLLPGLTYLKKSGKIEWSVQALGTLRPFNNSIGYHYGNEATANAWAAYQFCPLVSASLRLEGNTSAGIKGQDSLIFPMNESDADPKNYGGQRASGFVGLNFYINKGFMRDSKIGAEFGIPFYQNLNGLQLSIQNTFSAAITKSF